MVKPVITTRTTKGSALTWTEGDTNLENLRDATVTIKADTGGTDVVSDLNGTVTLVAGTNISISGDNTAKTVTITNTQTAGATTLDGLSDVVITAAATGEVLQYNGTNWVDVAPSTLTVGTATNATNSTKIYSQDDGVTNATYYPTFAITNPGSGAYINVKSDTGLTYNPSTGTLGATAFSGTAYVSSTVTLTADNSTNATNYPLFVNAATGNLSPRTDTGFTYNPSTGALSFVTWDAPSGTVISIAGSTSSPGQINSMRIGNTTASTGAFTTLSATSTVTGSGFTNRFASPGPIGNTTASTGAFTTLSATGVITSTLATGTAPFTVASTTKVTNLNVEQVDGYHADTANTVSTIAVRDGSGIITASGFSGALNGTVGATTPSTGAFSSLTFKNPIEAIYDLGTTGGTVAPDPANGSVQKITLNSALTINGFTNATAGESITVIIYGGTAYTSITSTMKFAGGDKTLTATAGCIDILSIYYDGTTYFASIGKGFA